MGDAVVGHRAGSGNRVWRTVYRAPWLATALLVGLQSASASDATIEPDGWRDSRSCGPNALYALLKLHDRNVSYDEVRSQVKPGPMGASMLQLEEAATALGLPCEVRRFDFGNLATAPLPAIAHYSGVRDGHFVIVLAVHGSSVVVADMSSCNVYEEANADIKRLWSGYLMVPRDQGRRRLIGSCVAVGSVLIAVSLYRLLRRVGDRFPFSLGVARHRRL